jgi:Predicted membrane protein
VCNKCDKSFRLAEVNAGGGGCKPVPLEHRVSGDELVIAEADILEGWRLFR